MLLAIDSSQGTSVALLDEDGRVVTEREDRDPRGHAEAIGPLLTIVTDRPISAVAYGVGPGPYTGLRVGIAAARAVAFARGVAVLPVLSHDAVALDAVEAGVAGPFAVVADARRRERYWTVYEPGGDGLPIRLDGPSVGADELVPDLPRRDTAPCAASLGRVALLRRRAGLPPEPPEARYLRPADVTLAPRKRVGT